MSNSTLVNVRIPANTNNYKIGRNGQKIEMITIHHMAGVLTAEECGAIFQDKNRKASSHYGIGKDGKIALYVDEENTAYTNGNLNSNYKSVTIETSNSEASGSYPVSDEVLNVLIKLVADIAKRNNLGTLVKGKNLTWHSLYYATSCPGEYLLSKIDYIVEEANKINNGTAEPGTPTPDKKSNEEIANEVIKGDWGNGEERKTKLTQAGYNYDEIQRIVNQKLQASGKKSNEEIANEVIKGDWGNGEERKTKLTQAGYNYDEIQKIVNQKLQASGKKSNEEIANEVIKGDWGNGEERKTKLTQAGYNYDEIQKIVNQKLQVSGKKSNEEIANEVIKGNWGNGEERKTKLTQAGYDYDAIQKIVNEKLK